MKIKTSLLFLLICSCYKAPQEELVLVQIHDRHGITETISDPDRLNHYEQADFLTPQPYQKVLRLFRHNGANRSVLTTYHPNGSVWQMLEAQEMRALGAYREWFANGVQKIDARVIGGEADLTPSAQESWLFDGISEVYDEQNVLVARVHYEKGELSKTSKTYYQNGSLQKETPYLAGTIHGEEREFWENGELKSKTIFSKGKKEGMSLGFYDDGSLCWEEMFEYDLLQSGTYWSRSQELVCKIHDGFGMKALFEEGRLCKCIEFRNGKVEGVVKNYGKNEQLQSFYHLKEGKKQGDEIEYYAPQTPNEPLRPKLSLSWDQDLIHGTVKTWYENGQMQSQREIYKNKLSGTACSWYQDGSLMLLEEYENNRLLRGQYYRKKTSSPVSTITNGNGTATLYDGEGIFLQKVTYVKGYPTDPE